MGFIFNSLTTAGERLTRGHFLFLKQNLLSFNVADVFISTQLSRYGRDRWPPIGR